MAMTTNSVLTVNLLRRSLRSSSNSKSWVVQRNMASWKDYFKKDKKTEQTPLLNIRKMKKDDGPSTMSRLESLKKREGLISVRGYDPPPGVDETIATIAKSVMGSPVDAHMALEDRKTKFELMRRLQLKFDHFIPNTELNDLHTLDDLVIFFSTPVKDRNSLEDMAQLDLPPNLHIQMEPVRFNPETDTFFDGKTAFPGSPTIVSSIRYRRKYKGNSGESRHDPNRTNFEEQVMFPRKVKKDIKFKGQYKEYWEGDRDGRHWSPIH